MLTRKKIIRRNICSQIHKSIWKNFQSCYITFMSICSDINFPGDHGHGTSLMANSSLQNSWEYLKYKKHLAQCLLMENVPCFLSSMTFLEFLHFPIVYHLLLLKHNGQLLGVFKYKGRAFLKHLNFRQFELMPLEQTI